MSTPAVLPQLVGDLGTPELLIILAVVVLLFGSSKLPELARGSGRALRIFKAETKGLTEDDEPASPSATTSSAVPAADVEAQRRELAARQAKLDAEREDLRGQSV